MANINWDIVKQHLVDTGLTGLGVAVSGKTGDVIEDNTPATGVFVGGAQYLLGTSASYLGDTKLGDPNNTDPLTAGNVVENIGQGVGASGVDEAIAKADLGLIDSDQQTVARDRQVSEPVEVVQTDGGQSQEDFPVQVDTA